MVVGLFQDLNKRKELAAISLGGEILEMQLFNEGLCIPTMIKKPPVSNHKKQKETQTIPTPPTKSPLTSPFATLLPLLDGYSNDRKKNPDEYFHYSFFSKFFGGFSKTEKLAAVSALQEAITNENSPSRDIKQLNVLRQGTLGKLIDLWEKQNDLTIEILFPKTHGLNR